METNSLSSLVFVNSVFRCFKPPQQIFHLHYIPDLHEISRSIAFSFARFFGNNTFRIIGSSSNGLICLVSKDNQLGLFNPSTRLFKLVPKLDYPFQINSCYGFGYDNAADDYKIVRVLVKEFMVYSLRTDSWKIMKRRGKLKLSRDHNGDCVLVNNRLHWKLETDDDILCILSFDLHDEEWSEVPMPNLSHASINVSLSSSLGLGVLDGSLCVLSSGFSNDEDYTDVWMMREYGVEESWTKVYRFPYFGLKPLGSCSKDGREILFSKGYGDGVFIWNSELKMTMWEIDDPVIHYIPVVKCIESLTPLMGTHLLKGKKTGKKKTTRNNKGAKQRG